MTFAENINKICAERGTKLTPLLKKLGFSTSKVTAINKGQIPNNERDLLKIANALNCSIMDLFNDGNSVNLNQNNIHSIVANNGSTNDLSTNDSNNKYTTNNYYAPSRCDTQKSNSVEVHITKKSKEYFFQLLDKLRDMSDEQLLEMNKYADFVITKNDKKT